MTRGRSGGGAPNIAITGAARGIGLAAATALARDGARVAVGDLDSQLAREVAERLGADHVGLEVDVSDAHAFAAFLDAAEAAIGPLDVLVNNAGIMVVGPFLDTDPAASARMLAVNLVGTMHGTRLAAQRMVARGGGQIVNVVSAAAYVVAPGETTYAASKHAVRALTDGVRDELQGTGVRLTGVYPGFVDTELAAGTTPTRGTKLLAPRVIGDAIAAAVRRPRDEVFVPRELAFTLRFSAALPARPRKVLGRLFGVDAVATRVDPSVRAAYMARIGASADESSREDAGHA